MHWLTMRDTRPSSLLQHGLLSIGMVVGLVALSGCGGDGGYGYCGPGPNCSNYVAPAVVPPVASTSTFAIAPALTASATTAQNYAVHSVDGFGNAYTLNLTITPGPATTFSGASAISTTVNQSLYQNGVLVNVQQFTNFYDPTGTALLGSTGATPGSFTVVTANTPAPATAVVGQTFPSFTETIYHDSTLTVSDGTLVETLAVNADTASTALLCMNDAVQLTATGVSDGLNPFPSASCFRINTAGAILGLVATLNINGVALTFQ